MKRLVFALAIVALCGRAYAEESCANVASTTGGTSVLAAADNKGNTLLVQNIGGTNAVTCSVGGTPVSLQHGFYLPAAGGSITMSVSPVTTNVGSGQSRLPAGAVTCITGSSTSYVCASSW